MCACKYVICEYRKRKKIWNWHAMTTYAVDDESRTLWVDCSVGGKSIKNFA